MMATRARSRPRHVIAATRRPTPRHADALPIGDARLQDPPLRRQVRVRAVRSSDALRDDARRRDEPKPATNATTDARANAGARDRRSTKTSAHRPRAVAVTAEQKQAVCVLTGTAGVSGVLKLSQSGDAPTKVVGSITGLAPGKHGLHIHEFGDTTNGCMSTGPHFNPNKMDHGAPTDATRHAGDLGNVEATAGGCDFVIEDSQIPLSGANSIIGRAFVIHELEDDLGKGDSSEIGTQGKTSKTTGNAGAVRRRRDFDAISTIATRRDAISTRV